MQLRAPCARAPHPRAPSANTAAPVQLRGGSFQRLSLCRPRAAPGPDAGDASVAGATAPATEDPWRTPTQPRAASEAAERNGRNSSDQVVAAAASGPEVAGPSPWDKPTGAPLPPAAGPNSTAQPAAAAAPNRGGYVYDDRDAASAAAAAIDAATAAAKRAAAAEAVGAASPNSAPSSSASAGVVENGPRRQTVREASAALSEDTAALLARLRAELARTSNIKMPPRRMPSASPSASTSSSASSSSSASAAAAPSRPAATPPSAAASQAAAASAGAGAGAGAETSTSAPRAGSPGSGSGPSASAQAPSVNSAAGARQEQPAAEQAAPAAAAAEPPAAPAPAPVASSSEPAAVGAEARPGPSAAAAGSEPDTVTAAVPSVAPTVGDEGVVLGPMIRVTLPAKPPSEMSEAVLAAALEAAGAPPLARSAKAGRGEQAGGWGAGGFGGLGGLFGGGGVGGGASGALAGLGIKLPGSGSSGSGSAEPAKAAASAAAAAPPRPAAPPPAPKAAPAASPSPKPSAAPGASTAAGAGPGAGVGARVKVPASSWGKGGGKGVGGKRRAVVVGGGIGGLVSAARLAKEGLEVVLLESNSQVGGRCQSMWRGRYRFDPGPSLLLFIETYRKTFEALGTSLAQQVPVVRVTPAAYRVFFQGEGSLDLLYDVQRMMEQLEGIEKGAGGQYLDWLASARAALELGVEGFIEKDAGSVTDLVAQAMKDEEMRSLLSAVGLTELLGNHHERMSKRFRDPRLRALFTFQDLYVGLSPYTAPGVYSLLAATELTEGVWYPLGGFGQIRDALLRVAQGLGVRVRCGARATAIRTTAGPNGAARITGVGLASGEVVDADVVVSNRDVPLTYDLVTGAAEAHGASEARRLLGGDFSAGVICYCWSLDKKLEPLLHHNVFLSGDFEGSWVRATSADTLARSPNFYVHCPGRTDPTAAPTGADSIMVLLPVANIQEIVRAQEAERRRKGGGSVLSGLPSPLANLNVNLSIGDQAAAGLASSTAPVDYSELVKAGREAIFRTLAEAGMKDVKQHIVDELIIDPVQWRERYALAHGAAFGLSHGLNQLSIFRPANADAKIRGLYLTGASTRPGNGVPLAMVSGQLASDRVLKDLEAGVLG
ncbi:hypothetical protein HYH03_008930 [Edaphochlamys debaryana]|uniref:Amine oxidase domain-containing protein n=1 Tax=Edaphochlamys debaryana TaxID=47281 RepID=A0A835XZB3_9CHLO|nr:hypothetical protein HYH03_008930 [Edaphochlamys debaryana]|eukprot:KAG2492765.1 hypothetical protein HYH03_008930 [Edaphochlamys debaryana]